MSGEELYWKPKSIMACKAEEEEEKEEVNNPLNHKTYININLICV